MGAPLDFEGILIVGMAIIGAVLALLKSYFDLRSAIEDFHFRRVANQIVELRYLREFAAYLNDESSFQLAMDDAPLPNLHDSLLPSRRVGHPKT